MDRNKLRVLVVSDLHAICGEEGDYSYLKYKDGESLYERLFFEFLEEENVSDVDLLVCSGDIGTHGKEDSFKAGWKFLNRSKDKLGSPEMIAVPGNHDHMSRPGMAFDPKHHLQFVDPPFPVDCFDLNTRFWAWHWCHYEGENYNAILLNSSAYHGFDGEYGHGRVSLRVVEQIEKYLKSDSFPKKPINIFLCHHHPAPMSAVDNDYDNETMMGGDFLLEKIRGTGVGPWLFVHGHKHFPKIVNSTDGCDISILSAGSFAASLHSEILGKTSNQFYILDLNLEKTAAEERVYGTFQTYEYAIGKGWRRSTSDNLPAFGGFGNLDSPARIARLLEAGINEDNPYLNESDISGLGLNLEYLSPSSLERVKAKLTSNGLVYELDRGRFISIGKCE